MPAPDLHLPTPLELDFDARHTLGFLGTDWIEAHCRVPGGVYEGEALSFNGWQLYCTVNHYRIKSTAVVDPRRLIAPFHYRRSIIVGPQKSGKARGALASCSSRLSVRPSSMAGPLLGKPTDVRTMGARAAGSTCMSLARRRGYRVGSRCSA